MAGLVIAEDRIDSLYPQISEEKRNQYISEMSYRLNGMFEDILGSGIMDIIAEDVAETIDSGHTMTIDTLADLKPTKEEILVSTFTNCIY